MDNINDNNNNMVVEDRENLPLPPEPEPEPANVFNEIYTDKAMNNFIEGNFDYIPWYDRDVYANAWQAITVTETWEFVKNYDVGSFMLSTDTRVHMIASKMVELGYDGHSGSSFGCIMRVMQYIAKYGEQKFMSKYIEAQNEVIT
jgi:hypothetical protein